MKQAIHHLPRASFIMACFLSTALLTAGPVMHKAHKVDFNRPDGPYTVENFRKDFGNFGTDDAFTAIVDGALRVNFPEGRKIDGLQGARVAIAPSHVCNLQFRVRYPKDFQKGLHGKQFGLAGGAAYTGGRGAEAARKGDGWSVRLQFDAHGEDITNQLYVYHADMKGQYGEDLGTHRQQLKLKRGKWHLITLRVTMQSAPEKADGRVEAWIDGRRGTDLRNIHFVAGPKGRVIDRLLLESFCGGYGATPGKDQFVLFDDIRWDCQPAR